MLDMSTITNNTIATTIQSLLWIFLWYQKNLKLTFSLSHFSTSLSLLQAMKWVRQSRTWPTTVLHSPHTTAHTPSKRQTFQPPHHITPLLWLHKSVNLHIITFHQTLALVHSVKYKILNKYRNVNVEVLS